MNLSFTVYYTYEVCADVYIAAIKELEAGEGTICSFVLVL